LTERKRRGKPNKQATRDYRNNKKVSESTKSIDTKTNTKKVSYNENQEASSSQLEQPTATTATATGATTTEVFASSSYDPTSEKKNSARIYEDDLKKAIPTIQKNEPIKAEDTDLQATITNSYSRSVNSTTIMQEEMSVSGGSRDGSSYCESRRLNDENPFTSSMELWQSSMNNCIGIYKVFSENAAKMMREYWMKPFWLSDK
jgi:hypothetical protein